VALGIDISRAFRFPDEVTRLVAAVIQAGSEDESSWIEWKERLELTKEQPFWHVPHTVLGFANRDPATAAQWAGGYAYLIIGAEPGSCPGITPIDPGDLSARVRAYIGDRIGWHPQYVEISGVRVLVIAVDPPRAGDSIHTLHKRLREFAPGTVFTRLPGQTVQASHVHHEMLQQRCKAGAEVLEVTVEVVGPPCLEVAPDLEELIEIAAASMRERLLRPPPRPDRPVNLVSSKTPTTNTEFLGTNALAAALAGATSGLGFTPDQRTRQQYDEEVESYITVWSRAVAARAAFRQAGHAPCQLALQLVNNTDRNFAAVELSAQVPQAGHLDADALHWPALPPPPAPWGTETAPSWLSTAAALHAVAPYLSTPAMALIPSPHTRPAVSVTKTAGGIRLDYAPLDLRPRQARSIKQVPLALYAKPGDALEIRWSATAANADGRLEGIAALTAIASTLPVADLTGGTDPRDTGA
jgi:hypothetical protein